MEDKEIKYIAKDVGGNFMFDFEYAGKESNVAEVAWRIGKQKLGRKWEVTWIYDENNKCIASISRE